MLLVYNVFFFCLPSRSFFSFVFITVGMYNMEV
jgi:hypothetical protein